MSSKTLTVAAAPPPTAEELAPELAEPYRRLLRVLRASIGMFAMVPVESLLPKWENERLLERLRRDLERKNTELRFADVFYEDWDPLQAIQRAWKGLVQPAVVVLRGLERTPPAPLGMTKTPRPSAFARLNQVREHIENEFPAPLIVWCEPESFGALQRYAPDFFDHFTGLVRFGSATESMVSEVREPRVEYQLSRVTENLPIEASGSRSALRFYESQLEKAPEGSQERVRALLGLAESLLKLTGSERPAAAERVLEAAQQASASLSAEEEPQEWARAQYLQGGGYKAAGKLEDARASFERALAARRNLAAENPAVFEKDLAPTLVNLGIVLRELGKRDAARTSYEEALEIYRRLAERHPAAFELSVAMTLNNLGNVLRELGKRDAARTILEEALEIYRRLAEQRPAAFESDVAMTLSNLGTVFSDLDKHDAARNSLEEALKIRRRLAEQHPAAFEPSVAMTLNNLGTVLNYIGERDAARTAIEEALEIRRRLAKRHPAAFEPDVAVTLYNFGNVLRALDKRDDARNIYEEALEILEPLSDRWPAAFGAYFVGTLDNYSAVAPEDAKDPWRQKWQKLQGTGNRRTREQVLQPQTRQVT